MQADADAVRAASLVPCLNDPGQIVRHGTQLPGHPYALQLDSGMNRLGLEATELEDLLDRLPHPGPSLILSHLACADNPEHPMNATQKREFARLSGMFPDLRHSLAATAGILIGGDMHHHLTRPGIGLYGGMPFSEARPVVRLSLPVIQTRWLDPGETVGYGATWTAQKRSRIATLAAGYADGVVRALGNGGIRAFSGTASAPVVGRVSMDLIAVDITELDEEPEEMELLNTEQTIDDLAEAAGTISYEILTGLGQRFARSYRGGGASSAP